MSLSIWMTYWSIPMTFPSTNDTSRKYSTDSTLMAFSSVQINVNSTSLPVNTSGTCSLPDGLTMASNKVQIIQDWLEPCKVKDIQSFLGFTNFYHRFIYGYSRITVLLTRLTHKGVLWHFTDECCSAFNALKKAFTSAPVLTHWMLDVPITVETDASDYALAAVLSVTTPSGDLHPVAFHSHTFHTPECNYDVHDKELLAIYEAFRQW